MNQLLQEARCNFSMSSEKELIYCKVNVTSLLIDQQKNKKNAPKKHMQMFRQNPYLYFQFIKKTIRISITQQYQEGKHVAQQSDKDQQAYTIEQSSRSNFSLQTIGSLKRFQSEQIFRRKMLNLLIRFVCIPYSKKIYKQIEDITANDIKKWVVFQATIVQVGNKKTLQKMKTYKCKQCGCLYFLTATIQNYYQFQLPPMCTNMVIKNKQDSVISKLFKGMYKNKSVQKPKTQQLEQQKKAIKQKVQPKKNKCGSRKFEPIQQGDNFYIDYLQIKAHTSFRNLNQKTKPKVIKVVIEGDSITELLPGDDVSISGLVSYRYKKLIKNCRINAEMVILADQIKVQRVQNLKQQDLRTQKSMMEDQLKYPTLPSNFYRQYNLSQKDNLIIKQLQFRKHLVQSFCPRIHGRQLVKLGLFLSLLGGVSLENQGTQIRGISHILLIGQPATGKSVLLRAAEQLSQRSVFTTGPGSTAAGLSVAFTKQEGDWKTQPGALVLADKGTCCIDQINLLDKKAQKVLLQCMEQQKVSSAKAGIHNVAHARATIIAACNPKTKNQHYDLSLDLQTNAGLILPLLTRFDQIFILNNDMQMDEQSERTQHILENFMEPHFRKNRVVTATKSKNNTETGQIHTKFSKTELKYFIKKCKNLTPELQETNIFSQKYVQLREKGDKSVTVRSLQAMIRLSEAHAKMMMRQKTQMLDYVTAIMMIEQRYFQKIEDFYMLLDNMNEKWNTSFGHQYEQPQY